ncbi:hypothetical protein, partial [Mitsuaria sp. TWR114]|uniref:hypothetical protein n=1 Tax=Mitsuaria sp. TWR114 TaxID=2601731 RepID=UPI002105868D
LLPAVLLLNGGDACVLVRRLDDDAAGGVRYEVVFPGPEAASCVAPPRNWTRNTAVSSWR